MSGHASEREAGTDSVGGRTRYQSDPDEKPSEAVVAALSTATGRDCNDGPWLYEQVDPDALDALFAPTIDGRQRGEGRVQFDVGDYSVVVRSDGDVVVSRRRCR